MWVIFDPGKQASGSSHVRYAQKAEIRVLASASMGALRIDGAAPHVISTPKPEPRIMRYELSVFERAAIKPMLPDKPRGVPRVGPVRIEIAGAKDYSLFTTCGRDCPGGHGPSDCRV